MRFPLLLIISYLIPPPFVIFFMISHAFAPLMIFPSQAPLRHKEAALFAQTVTRHVALRFPCRFKFLLLLQSQPYHVTVSFLLVKFAACSPFLFHHPRAHYFFYAGDAYSLPLWPCPPSPSAISICLGVRLLFLLLFGECQSPPDS